MYAIILSVGDELVLGQTVDTNSAWLAERLARLGITCLYHQTIADDQPTLADAIEQAAKRAELVVVTGGLGPTGDDLTRQALAAAMGVDLVEDPASLAALEQYFAGRGRTMPAVNRVQALHPVGTTLIPNARGTAPGIKAHLHRATVYVTPGVPSEMKAMYHAAVEPELVRAGQTSDRGVILTTKVNTFGWGESKIAEKLGELMQRDRNPKVGTTVADGQVAVRIRSAFATAGEAHDQLHGTLVEVNRRLGPIVFGLDQESLPEAVVQLLQRRGQRLATAESCTGGLLGRMITDVPGCSAAYMGGWIVYSNLLKIDQLGIPRDTLEQHGAVSEQTVRLLAEHALTKCGADLSLAISGVAGPDGGDDDKPVGTVWLGMGVRDEHDADHIDTHAILLNLGGDRETIRDRAARSALQMLRFHLMGQPLDLLEWGRTAAGA